MKLRGIPASTLLAAALLLAARPALSQNAVTNPDFDLDPSAGNGWTQAGAFGSSQNLTDGSPAAPSAQLGASSSAVDDRLTQCVDLSAAPWASVTSFAIGGRMKWVQGTGTSSITVDFFAGSGCSGSSPGSSVPGNPVAATNGFTAYANTGVARPAGTVSARMTLRVHQAGSPDNTALARFDHVFLAASPGTATVTGGGTICAGRSAQVQAVLTGLPPFGLVWSDGFVQSNVTDTAVWRSVSPSSTTTYTLTSFSDANGSGSRLGSALVTVGTTDLAAPVVTPPAPVTIVQTLCCGAFGGASGATSAALAVFLAAGSAVDDCDPSPARLTPQAGGGNATNATCFGSGVTTVTFRFQDAATHIGTATSTATVRMFGDLNLDASVDPSDMVVLRAYFNFVVVPGTSPFTAPLGMADVNHDATVDPSDLVVLRAYFNFVLSCLAP